MTLEMAKAHMTNEETRRKEQGFYVQSGVYVMHERERSRTQHPNHEPRDNSKILRKNVKYFYCHKMGH
jgi:hypothetical protein